MLEMTTIITVSKEGILKEVRLKELNENEIMLLKNYGG